ncbi:hypothetical protein GWI33_012699 [Rhynchophorus ferrugineus]|uniref:Uncharacterized protein n=1 Tax=Rhynchophorus ferrugineus TaxID=354439 RepID=A0A834I9L9_RHYFE|nr:hypothetical protein GWI33_012699 [Rhynchophorus ferrugineus]
MKQQFGPVFVPSLSDVNDIWFQQDHANHHAELSKITSSRNSKIVHSKRQITVDYDNNIHGGEKYMNDMPVRQISIFVQYFGTNLAGTCSMKTNKPWQKQTISAVQSAKHILLGLNSYSDAIRILGAT